MQPLGQGRQPPNALGAIEECRGAGNQQVEPGIERQFIEQLAQSVERLFAYVAAHALEGFHLIKHQDQASVPSPYRETIRGKAEAQGRHKKQSGGHGQFGDCKIRMEPLPRGGGFEFENDVFGGAIPRNFIPAVEKGIVESAARGYLAGYPVVDFKVVVYDGSYHDVDSNELSFKKAGRLAFRKAMELCKPCLLEPIMKVEIEAPDEFAGTLMGDLNGRRGRVGGMESKGRTTVINAQVPMAEMLTYGTLLTSMTQGKGSYRMEVDHYDIVPQLVAEKILANAKRPDEEEEE